MYQLEVKRCLVEHQFRPADGWTVTVDVDAMERAKGGQHPPDKKERARRAEEWLEEAGVTIGSHPEFKKVDLVATKDTKTVLVEVEGDSSKPRSQKLYSALGQSVRVMRRIGIFVTDSPSPIPPRGKARWRISPLLCATGCR